MRRLYVVFLGDVRSEIGRLLSWECVREKHVILGDVRSEIRSNVSYRHRIYSKFLTAFLKKLIQFVGKEKRKKKAVRNIEQIRRLHETLCVDVGSQIGRLVETFDLKIARQVSSLRKIEKLDENGAGLEKMV